MADPKEPRPEPSRHHSNIYFPLTLIAMTATCSCVVLADFNWAEQFATSFGLAASLILLLSITGAIVTGCKLIHPGHDVAEFMCYLLAAFSSIVCFEALYARENQLTLETEMKIAMNNTINQNPIQKLGVKLKDSQHEYYILCDYKYGFGIFVLKQNGDIGTKYYIPHYMGQRWACAGLGDCKNMREMKDLMNSILSETSQDPFKLSFGLRKLHDMNMPTEQANRWIQDGLRKMSKGIQEL